MTWVWRGFKPKHWSFCFWIVKKVDKWIWKLTYKMDYGDYKILYTCIISFHYALVSELRDHCYIEAELPVVFFIPLSLSLFLPSTHTCRWKCIEWFLFSPRLRSVTGRQRVQSGPNQVGHFQNISLPLHIPESESVFVFASVCLCVCVFMFASVCLLVCVRAHSFECVCACACFFCAVRVCVWLCAHVFVCVYACVCVCVTRSWLSRSLLLFRVGLIMISCTAYWEHTHATDQMLAT